MIRLCMKHFRQRNMLDLFESLQLKTQLRLEDPLLTELNQLLVRTGDFSQIEQLLENAAKLDLFEEYISDCKYKPLWKRLTASSLENEAPCMRGGHQMCIDSDAGLIYLLGGWNGTQDLSDFWVYNIDQETWRCISKDTARQNGPGARSCHKICFDSKTRRIYTLGKYIDSDSRPNMNLENDFWYFDTGSESWKKLSQHTAVFYLVVH